MNIDPFNIIITIIIILFIYTVIKLKGSNPIVLFNCTKLNTFIKNAFYVNTRTMRNLCRHNALPVAEKVDYEIKDENGTVIGKISGTLLIHKDLTADLQSNDDLRKEEFDVFISYCWGKENKNKERVLNICNQLEKWNFKCWLDQNQLNGNDLFATISTGILKSKLFLCCIDSEYCKSNSTITEFYFANYLKKQIKPILFEPLDDLIKIDNNPIAIHIPAKFYEKFYSQDNKKPINEAEQINNLAKVIDSILKEKERIPHNDFTNLNATKGEAIQLIKIENDKILINPEAENIIRKINGPIAVISVVGPSRSGKSYLVNRLLHLTNGFKSHSNVEACTKGIWFWSGIEWHMNEKNEEMNLLVMDTEGLNHIDSSVVLESKLFFLSILMSSQVIYNTEKVIDEDSLCKLAKMCSLCKIQSLENDNENSNWPTFIWVLRNFKLKHAFKSDDEYFENVISLKSSDTQDQQNNKLTISKWFIPKKRHCVTLPEPVSDGEGYTMEDKLSKLSELDASLLRPRFNILVNEFIKLARDIVTPHRNFDSGKTLMSYINQIVCSLNNDNIINLQTIKNSVIECQTSSYIAVIEESIYKLIEQGPMDPETFEKQCDQLCQIEQKKNRTFCEIKF